MPAYHNVAERNWQYLYTATTIWLNMSFFDDTQKLGLVLIIVGILSIISAIFMIAAGFVDDLINITIDGEDLDGNDKTLYCVIAGIGSLIGAIIYFLFGKQVRSGAISAKIDVLATYVRTVGVVMLIGGIFGAAAAAAAGAPLGGVIVSAIVTIIISLIIIWIASKINDGKQSTGDKIIWVLLVIAFIIMLILSILECITIIGIIDGICGVLISLFMLGFLFDSEVKAQMNM